MSAQVGYDDVKENSKEHRRRTKDMVKRIQKQLDFYFGDANLRHDRFLRREIGNSADGYVEVDMIASFNKMKEICTDRKVLLKAIKKLDSLELDESEKHLRRKVPLPVPGNTDNKTVYVEYLPAYANHDWLMDIFGTCGKVDYVSLPRYKSSGLIKGFGFVEFSSEEAASRAVQELNTVVHGTGGETHQTEHDSGDGQGANCKNSNTTLDPKEASTKKRKLSGLPDDELSDSTSKKSKRDSNGAADETTTGDEATSNDESSDKTKKRKKRKRKRKVKGEKDSGPPPLYVISKKDWMSKKALYKKLQRGETAAAKSVINSTQRNDKLSSNSEQITDQSRDAELSVDIASKPMVVPFVQQTVLKLETSSESLTKADVKAMVSHIRPIAYVDFSDLGAEGFLRFHDADSAQAAFKAQDDPATSWPFRLSVLSEGEETAYHAKITADRLQRFEGKKRQQRGIDKINRKLQKVKPSKASNPSTHMHFD